MVNHQGVLLAYKMDEDSLIKTAFTVLDNYILGLDVSANGHIFVANSSNGLIELSFENNKFSLSSQINNGGSSNGVAVFSAGTVFLANGSDGLRVYLFDCSSLTNTGHVGNGGYAQ